MAINMAECGDWYETGQHGVYGKCCWILGVKMNLIPPRHKNVLDWLNMMG